MAPETYLSVLTFLGLVVGFGSGLISQLKRTSNDVPGSNEKKLTSFGKLALGISLVGFAGSFASALLSGAVSAQHAKDARSQQEEETKWKARSTDLASEILRNTKSALEDSLQTRFAIAETRQKVLNDNLLRETRLYGRITAAGAPLTSMQITLVVEQVPADVREQIRKGESNAFYKVHHDWPYVRDWIPLTSAEETSAAQSIVDQEFIPKFISFLISDKFRNDQSVLGLCLDRHFSSVLSVGWITRPDAFEMESGKSLAPSGIRIESDPPVKRKKTSPPEVHIGLEKDAVVLTLELAADSLDDGVVRYLSNVGMTSALRNDIELFVWSPRHVRSAQDANYGKLPFDTRAVNPNLLALDRVDDEEEQARWVKRMPVWTRRMRLRIVPNDVQQISRTYNTVLFGQGELEEGYGYARIWHGHAQ